MINTSTRQKNITRNFRALVPALLIFLSATTSLFGGEKYLSERHPDGIALLPPPPSPESAEQKADLNAARAVFKARTADEEKRAIREASLSLFNFTPAIGSAFQPGTFPKTEALFESLKKELKDAISTPKDNWKRSRPYQIDASLTLGKPEASFSYPSGHSARGTVQALLLAEIFPDHRDAILQTGRNIGWDRVLIGKHFPTDVYAGRVLGMAIVRELLANAAFQHDLAEAKAEVKAAQK